MRIRLLIVVGSMLPLVGAVCTPPGQLPREPREGTTLAVVLHRPAANRTVALGSVVTIEWSATNLTDAPATVSLLVESRPGLELRTLASGLSVTGSTYSGVYEWDTTEFEPSEYKVFARISTTTRTEEGTAAGRVTVDGRPTFEFTGPDEVATLILESDEQGTVTIAWNFGDPEGNGNVRVGVDLDLDDHGSGNEIYIKQQDLPDGTQAGSFEWNGDDDGGEPVEPGTYNVFALADDESNPLVTAEGLAQIIVQAAEEPVEPVTLSIIEPKNDVEFLGTTETLKITFGVNEPNDVLIDLKIDTDDNHANGNEVTVHSELIAAGTETSEFEWNGEDANGDPVPNGIYTLVILANTGSGTPRSAAGKGLVFRRDLIFTAVSQQLWELSANAWSLLEPETSPSPRRDHAVTFDSEREILVLFGGSPSGALSDETWEWDRDEDWAEKDVPGPPALMRHALAYDAERKRTVLFGGSDGGAATNATWEWNGDAWIEGVVAGPSARFGHAMAYDAQRKVVVLFGGTDGTTRNAETWEWDGSAWTQKTPADAPTARDGHALAYDDGRDVVVLFGGRTDAGLNDETWEWDGTTWKPFAVAGAPAARERHALAYDASRPAVVLFGGIVGTLINSETWAWDGTVWTQLEPPVVPQARAGHALAFDTGVQRPVMLGGSVGLPLIAVLEPASIRQVNPGNFLTIRWRDDDPTGEALVRVTVDDDRDPDEVAETGAAEIPILAEREAAGDGVEDSFAWQVPGTLVPGTYYIFAYIDRDGAAPWDHNSVGPALFVVVDPTQ